MKKSIRRLDESVSSRIAAGEVIESPASVVKELLENALDAYARTVRVSLRQGGKGRIVVEDDGHGIPFGELPLAVERFATSKISGTEDLEKIGTLGYRGEALASLAAVSRLEIRSLAEGSSGGGLLKCTAGVIEAHLEIPVEKGTRVQADDLFFNLPARRKFLKQAASETRKVGRLLRDYAVAYPEVDFSLSCDGRAVYSTAGVRERRELLEEQWGNDPAIHFKKSRTGDMVVDIHRLCKRKARYRSRDQGRPFFPGGGSIGVVVFADRGAARICGCEHTSRQGGSALQRQRRDISGRPGYGGVACNGFGG